MSAERGEPAPGTGYILVVDDTAENLAVLARLLRGAGYEVRPVLSGRLALQVAAREAPDLILLDVRMPEMDGYEVCRRLKEDEALKGIPVVFVSAAADMEVKVRAFTCGGVDFVTKPFEALEVLARVRTHLAIRQAERQAIRQSERQAEARLNQLSLQRLESSMEDTIKAIAGTVELRDPYTAGHQRRVAQLAVALGCDLGLPATELRGLHLASIVHDLAKLHVPADILTKPSHLSPDEFSQIKDHAEACYDLLKPIDFPWPIAQIVRQHHERLDGSGYPHGLRGTEILFQARILAVADVVEAMVSLRPYRPALTIEAALDEMTANQGTLFDAQVVASCVRLFREQGFQFI